MTKFQIYLKSSYEDSTLMCQIKGVSLINVSTGKKQKINKRGVLNKNVSIGKSPDPNKRGVPNKNVSTKKFPEMLR